MKEGEITKKPLFPRHHPTLYQHLEPQIPDAKNHSSGQEFSEDKSPKIKAAI